MVTGGSVETVPQVLFRMNVPLIDEPLGFTVMV